MISRLATQTASHRLAYRIKSLRFQSDLSQDEEPQVSGPSGDNRERCLPFEKIPEPNSLPLIGTLLDYTPFRGFDAKRVHEFWYKRHEEYGDIFKEKIPGSNYCVFCRTREDNERLFRMEGRMPYRIYIEPASVIKAIMGYPRTLVNEEGEVWLRLRQPLNKLLLKKQTAWKYTKVQRNVCEDATEYIFKHRDENFEVPGLANVLSAWAFEITGTFIFNERLGLLQDHVPTEIQDALHGIQKIFEILGGGFTNTLILKTYKARPGLKRSILRTKEVLIGLVEKHKQTSNRDGSIMQDIIDLESLSQNEKESLLIDLLTASVDTTSNTAAICLYCLATNPRVQEKLRNEIKALTPQQRSSGRAIDSMKYMNAVFKETHRLLPFIHLSARVFDHDVVLSGFNVPAGTQIFNTINSTSNMNPNYFDNPDECWPERWMDNSGSKYIN